MSVKDGLIGRILGGAGTYTDKQVAQTIDLFIAHGLQRDANAIHIEPGEKAIAVRYRIHGRLHGMHKIPLDALEGLTMQLKKRAGLHTGISTPQEGSFSLVIEEQPVDIRTTTLPVVGGEKLVLHLTKRLGAIPSIESLGFWGVGGQEVRASLGRLHGLIVVASPKHTGRTETLYSLLQLAATPHVSIVTLERTITMPIPGVMQTVLPSHTNHTADHLKALLAQDPNIVMVNDLPDRQSLDAVLHAAANGHLMLAGMYADNASRALLHLEAMTSEPFLITAAAKLVVAERRVRRLCVHCRERFKPNKEQIVRIEKAFGMTTAAARKQVHELEQRALRDGVGGDAPLGTTDSHVSHLWQANENGCEQCYHTGYQGAVTLVEVLRITDSIKQLLIKKPVAGDIQTAAINEGFVPLALDGLIKALRGETTIIEVLQATLSL